MLGRVCFQAPDTDPNTGPDPCPGYRQLESGLAPDVPALHTWVSAVCWLRRPEAAHALAACDLPLVSMRTRA